MIPSTLKTGLVGEGPTYRIDPTSPEGKRLLGLVFVMIQRAAMTAAKYTEHSGRSVITVPDVQRALKYHAMTFLSEEGFQQLQDDVNKMQAFMETELEADPTSGAAVDELIDTVEDSDDDSDSEHEDSEHAETVCECADCAALATIDEQWDAWDPTDDAERFIRDRVQDTLNDT